MRRSRRRARAGLCGASNATAGADTILIDEAIHPSFRQLVGAACKTPPGLHVSGIDIVIANPAEPARDNNHWIIERNGSAALCGVYAPWEGRVVDVAGPYVPRRSYAGPLTLLFGENSRFNPFVEGCDPMGLWAARGMRPQVSFATGAIHGTYFRKPALTEVADHVWRLVRDGEAAGRDVSPALPPSWFALSARASARRRRRPQAGGFGQPV
ncbi:MAG: hypothetical protein AB7S99_05765 [Pseudodonghicola sp.]